jgi:type IV secretory pathway TraG/TraD family ATPase VirD4
LLRRRDDTLPPLNLVIDELNTLGKIEFLPTALERARKYRGKVILGYQSESQLMNLYGKDAGQSIKANTGTKFVFRSPEQQEAKELSDYLGRQEVGQKNVGTSYGSENYNDRESINEHDALRNIVLDSEIRDLPDGHFYLKSLNINPVKSRIVKKRWEKVFASDFCVPTKEIFDSKIIQLDEKNDDEQMFIIGPSLDT